MRIADPNPVVCSVCLQPPMLHDPQKRHVDFEVAYDGPVLTRHGDDITRPENYNPISIDDLIVCEDCLKVAGRLVGMVDDEGATAEIAGLLEQIAELELEMKDKDQALSDLDHTVGALIDHGHVAKRPPRRPRIVGPDADEAKLSELRKQVPRGKKKKVKA